MFLWSIPPDFEPARGWGGASSYGISITEESI